MPSLNDFDTLLAGIGRVLELTVSERLITGETQGSSGVQCVLTTTCGRLKIPADSFEGATHNAYRVLSDILSRMLEYEYMEPLDGLTKDGRVDMMESQIAVTDYYPDLDLTVSVRWWVGSGPFHVSVTENGTGKTARVHSHGKTSNDVRDLLVKAGIMDEGEWQ